MSDDHTRPGSDDPIGPAVARIIRYKANRMIGRAGLRPQDREDLEHDLVVRVLEQRHQFAPARGTWPAFVWRVVERAGDNVLRARGRTKRAARLTKPVPESAPAPDRTEGAARTADLARALEALSDDLRATVEHVLVHGVAGAARVLGISRPAVYARLRKVRARPAWAGLEIYCDPR
ncbi:RNA polymerase sigma factor [Gemmata sp. SH-PL17]|uniref:RNA polymerase sigma factor n=1 Tax=Gemmata sp. SH-PL17 TaxID=1630693 RepID=UPI00078D3E7A|nr:sigma-70 family RNA polymerase sigma factor [Gemmata sp. SH-PL17]AMV25157.1 RNA polymerase sigma factor [Gemmata sp. SH-PL17]